MPKGISEHALPVAIIMICYRINFRSACMNSFTHDFLHIRNEQTNHSSHPVGAYWFQRIVHRFMDMKNCAIEPEFSHVNTSIVVAKTKMFICP